MITLTENQKRFISRNKLRLFTGFGMVQFPMSIINFTGITIIVIKGFGWPVPTLVIVALGLVMGIVSWYLGFWYEMNKMWAYENSHTNLNMNPEVTEILNGIRSIQEKLK